MLGHDARRVKGGRRTAAGKAGAGEACRFGWSEGRLLMLVEAQPRAARAGRSEGAAEGDCAGLRAGGAKLIAYFT